MNEGIQDGLAHCRVENGSDDPDYLGHLVHFFGGSGGSHQQTKLSIWM